MTYFFLFISYTVYKNSNIQYCILYYKINLTTLTFTDISGEFDNTLEWPFKLKHKINIIDNRNNGEDLSSRIWDPTQLCSGWNWRRPDSGDNFECVGLGFPQEVLESKNYIHGNDIIIKLTVYLD